MKDIYELLSQKEIEFERVQKEVEALRIAAKLLDDSAEVRTTAAPAAPASRDTQGYATTPAPRATTPAATPTAWASAKQFP
ncbi:MAG: hypothetical protein DMG62_23270 [Acidobacteria bacterium]|nr:MAG: hypothetical protein DMG63_09485 [Acidobacteriota bacterium]PYY20544.1 MAG: hypothetical protein DMG62_23270 [Acidobacteriota bacterium]